MQLRKRLAIATALVIVVLALPACFLFPGAKRVGVSAAPGGGVRLHFVPCPGQSVTKVAYLEGVGAGFAEEGDDEPADDPEDDEILRWLIVARDGGASQTTFDVGETPGGFREELALDQDPMTVSAPAAWVAYRGESIGSLEIGFDPEDLQEGSILTLDGRKDPATFEREGLESC